MRRQVVPSSGSNVMPADQRCCKTSHAARLPTSVQRAIAAMLFATSVAGCAAPPEPDATAITPEKMLSALVGLATNEDLVDYERVAKLLQLRLEMKADSPQRFMDDGRLIRGLTAEDPVDPGYFPSQGARFFYSVMLQPYRRANFAVNFDRSKFCINIKDVLAQFGKYGTLRPGAPPISSPLPPGVVRTEITKDQPHYAYLFKGVGKTAVLTFVYSNCLTDFSTHQSEPQKLINR